MRRSQVCHALRARLLEALDPVPYRQDPNHPEEWHLSLRPFREGLDEEPDHLAHLSLVVFVPSSTSTTDYRDVSGMRLQWRSVVEVSFGYLLRPNSQIADFDLASNAADDITALVYDDESWLQDVTILGITQGFDPQLTRGEDLNMVVTLSFDIEHRSEI